MLRTFILFIKCDIIDTYSFENELFKKNSFSEYEAIYQHKLAKSEMDQLNAMFCNLQWIHKIWL